MNDQQLDSHSVNCIKCGKLFDERDGKTPEDGEGTLCVKCQEEELGRWVYVCRLHSKTINPKSLSESATPDAICEIGECEQEAQYYWDYNKEVLQ